MGRPANMNAFLATVFLFTAIMAFGYGEVRKTFSQEVQLAEDNKRLQKKLLKEKFHHLLSRHQLKEFRQDIAAVLPGVLKQRGEKTYPLRRIASVVQSQTTKEFQVTSARKLFNLGKVAFRGKNFSESNRVFKALIDRYPFSPDISEAYFLLTEGHFQKKEYEECVATASKMVNLFPESDLTGFALLRVGKIYEYRYRKQDALEVYQTILRSFNSRELASQANQSLRSVEL